MPDTLDRWHRRVVEQPLLRTLTVVVRVLLAIGFIPPGWVKLIGHRFTTLPLTDPVGYFFDGFFSAPGCYRFVGGAQVLAGVLLLFPPTTTLGAALYFLIILNIFVITVSIEFGGTRLIAGPMLLADVYLLCWDYDRWKALLPFVGLSSREAAGRHGSVLVTFGFLLAATIGFAGVLSLHRVWLRQQSFVAPSLAIAAGAAIGLVTLVRTLKT